MAAEQSWVATPCGGGVSPGTRVLALSLQPSPSGSTPTSRTGACARGTCSHPGPRVWGSGHGLPAPLPGSVLGFEAPSGVRSRRPQAHLLAPGDMRPWPRTALPPTACCRRPVLPRALRRPHSLGALAAPRPPSLGPQAPLPLLPRFRNRSAALRGRRTRVRSLRGCSASRVASLRPGWTRARGEAGAGGSGPSPKWEAAPAARLI